MHDFVDLELGQWDEEDWRWLEDITANGIMTMTNTSMEASLGSYETYEELNGMLQRLFAGFEYVVHTVIENHHSSKTSCPYLRIIMGNCREDNPINFKLQTLLQRVGIDGLDPRCSVAAISGLNSPWSLEDVCDLPYYLQLADMDQLEWDKFRWDAACVPPSLEKVYSFKCVSACLRCSVARVQCSGTIPCLQCNDPGQCVPSVSEPIQRAIQLQKKIFSGGYAHVDTVKYQLHLEMDKIGKRSLLRKKESKDIAGRLALMPRSLFRIESKSTEGLPPLLLSVKNSTSCVKVEWMYEGVYDIWTSPMYKENIIDENTIRSVSKHHGIAPKLVDFCNISDVDVAYLLWLKSTQNPMDVFGWVGEVYWLGLKEVKLSKINMITCFVSPTCMITVTALSYSNVGVFK